MSNFWRLSSLWDLELCSMHVCGFHKETIFTLYKANWQSRKLSVLPVEFYKSLLGPVEYVNFVCPAFSVRTRWWWRRNVHAEHEGRQKFCAATQFPFTFRTPRFLIHSTTSLLSSLLLASIRPSPLLWGTTRPTMGTGMPLCCHRRATVYITRRSAQPMGWVVVISYYFIQHFLHYSYTLALNWTWTGS